MKKQSLKTHRGQIELRHINMKKLLLIIILIGSKNLYSQNPGIRIAASPSLQFGYMDLDFVSKVNYSAGLLYEFKLSDKSNLKTGLELQYLGTKEHFSSCGNLTMLDGLLGDYFLIEVPLLLSFKPFENHNPLREKSFTLGVSLGRLLHDPTGGRFSMNYYSLIAGYDFRTIVIQSYNMRLGFNCKLTRISSCSGFVLSPGISLWITKH